jgi:4-hydroxy-3-polyprenylbenzoate decarboxylase
VRRLLVALAAPTGVIYGVRLLERLRDVPDLALYLFLTEPARRAVALETEYAVAEVEELADQVVGAAAASLPPPDGMVIAPCDIDAAAAVAASIERSSALDGSERSQRSDVGAPGAGGLDPMPAVAAATLERGHPLILLVHQTPLGIDHLRWLLRLTERGAVIMPPVPAFYNRPPDIQDVVLHTVARVIERLGLSQSFVPEWQGHQRRG